MLLCVELKMVEFIESQVYVVVCRAEHGGVH